MASNIIVTDVTNNKFQENLLKLFPNNKNISCHHLSLPNSNIRSNSSFLNDHIQWIYIRKSKWKSTELPSQAYVFLRKNSTTGVYQQNVYFYNNLTIVYSSNIYHIVAIPTKDIDDPIIIILLNQTRSMILPFVLPNEIINSCIKKNNLEERLTNQSNETFIPLVISTDINYNDDINRMTFLELFGQMLINITKTTNKLDFEKTFINDNVIQQPIESYYRISNPDISITNINVAKLILTEIENYAFIKYNDMKIAGLVVSMNRLRYYKKSVRLVDNPHFTLLDEMRYKVDQFIILNSPNVPGVFFNSEKSVLLEENHNILDNTKIYLCILKSISELKNNNGTGILEFSKTLTYGITNWVLNINPSEQSTEDIVYFKSLFENVYQR